MRRIALLLFFVQIVIGCGKHSDGNPEKMPDPGILSHGHNIEGSIATEGGGGADAMNGLFWNSIEELSSCLLNISIRGRGSRSDLAYIAGWAGQSVRTYEEMRIPIVYHFNSAPALAIYRHPEGRLDSDDFSRWAKLQVSYNLFPTTPAITERLYAEFIQFVLKGRTDHLNIPSDRFDQMVDLLAHLCSHDGSL